MASDVTPTDAASNDVEPGLVSVVIPTYNRSHCLARAVDSVLAQTHSAVEVILVDDGSRDDTRELVAARYGHDARVRYVWQQNTGVSGARNHGMRLARGEFVALLDSDDVWFPWKLEAQLAVLRAFPDAGMIWSDMEAIDPEGQVSHDRYLKVMYSAYHWFCPRDLFDRSLPLKSLSVKLPEACQNGEAFSGDLYSPMIMGNLVHTSTVVMRHERMLQVGDFLSRYTHGGEDYHFHLRTCRAGRVAFLDLPTIQYQVGLADQITRPESQIHFATSFLEILEAELRKHRERIKLPKHMLRSVLAEAHGWLASVAFTKNDIRLARQHSSQSLQIKPWQPDIWKLWLMSRLPASVLRSLRTGFRRLKSVGKPALREQAHV